jgi:lysozyme
MAIKGKTAGGIAGAGAAIALAITMLIAPWEGLSLKAYRDIVGVWTICFGETKGVEPGDVATRAECEAMLAKSVKVYADGLDACVVPDLPQKTWAALISWTYNIGVPAACSSTLVKLLNAGKFEAACDQLLRWNRAGGQVVKGLTNRREAERELCREGLGLAT